MGNVLLLLSWGSYTMKYPNQPEIILNIFQVWEPGARKLVSTLLHKVPESTDMNYAAPLTSRGLRIPSI
jgi:hypothetical protein